MTGMLLQIIRGRSRLLFERLQTIDGKASVWKEHCRIIIILSVLNGMVFNTQTIPKSMS